MTNEEALKFLDEHCTAYVIPLEVKALCSEALGKQIPKKPINKQFWLCPNCKAELYWDTDYGQQHFNYCTECGQAIDWGDEDDKL